jgi:hypothetical protein
MEGLRAEEVRKVVVECGLVFEAGAAWIGCGRKQNEKTLEIRVCRGGRQAQIIETFASREDQTAASALVSVNGLDGCFDRRIERREEERMQLESNLLVTS